MGKFCHTCHSYEGGIFTRAGESFGVCHNISVSTKIVLDGNTILAEDGIIYTEEYFGCIYWRENNGTLIDLGKTVNVKKILEERIKREEEKDEG